jgi:hypothetical protein
MKSLISDYEYELRLGGTAKSGIQKTRIRGDDLGYLHGHPWQRSDLAVLLAGTPLICGDNNKCYDSASHP